MSANPEATLSPRDEFRRMGLDRVPLLASIASDANVAALLRGIEYHACAPGLQMVNQGHYTNRLWIVLQGLADKYRAEPGAERPQHLGTLQPGDWFGEGSALSNQPALFSVEAKTQCTLISVEGATFKHLRQKEKAFQALVEKRYRADSLGAHLRLIPLFQALSAEDLKRIQEIAEFVVVGPEQVIAEQGAAADAVYLVRSGAVQCHAREKNGERRVLGFYMDNSCFGERSLAEGEPKWVGTFETMAPTDLVKIPVAALRRLVGPDSASQLLSTANQIVRQESGVLPGFFDLLKQARTEGASPDALEIMVSKQSVKGGHALVIDLARCVRCNACVESCVAVHADRVPRLSKTGSRISTQKTLASACYHCEIPECMMACGWGAIRRDVRGTIDFVWDNCVGCTACVSKCPYNVIRMTPPPEAGPDGSVIRDVTPSILASLPLIGHWFRPDSTAGGTCTAATAGSAVNPISGREEKKAGKAVKCDLCAGMPFEACVYNCPCSAIERVAPEALFQD